MIEFEKNHVLCEARAETEETVFIRNVSCVIYEILQPVGRNSTDKFVA